MKQSRDRIKILLVALWVTFTVTLGKGSHFELNGAIIGGGDQTLEIITAVTHAEPDATSGQTIRSILGQRATGSYLGSINVARDAQRTDAFQSFKAMLLDRTATANAKPELEIYADDAKRAHGGDNETKKRDDAEKDVAHAADGIHWDLLIN